MQNQVWKFLHLLKINLYKKLKPICIELQTVINLLRVDLISRANRPYWHPTWTHIHSIAHRTRNKQIAVTLVGGSVGGVWIERCVGEINNTPCPASRASGGWHAAADAPEPGLWMGRQTARSFAEFPTRGYIERTTLADGFRRTGGPTLLLQNTRSFTSLLQLTSKKDLLWVAFAVQIKVVTVE